MLSTREKKEKAGVGNDDAWSWRDFIHSLGPSFKIKGKQAHMTWVVTSTLLDTIDPTINAYILK